VYVTSTMFSRSQDPPVSGKLSPRPAGRPGRGITPALLVVAREEKTSRSRRRVSPQTPRPWCLQR